MNSRVIASARIVAAFLLAAMLFAAVACSGPKDEPEATPVPPAEEPTATPEVAPAAEAGDSPDGLEILKSSYERMSQASSFATVVATEIRTIGQSLNISTSVSRNVEGAMRILTTVEFPQGAQSTELIYDRTNAHAYVNVPGDNWRRTTPEALAEIAGLDIREYQVNFFAELIPPEDPPWDVYTVRYLGREEVEGTQTHHLGVTVELQDLLSRLSESEGEILLGTAGLSGAPLDVLEEARIGGVEVWIDDDGVPRKVTAQFLGGGQFATVLIDTSNVDGEVAIVLPAQFEEGLPQPEPQVQAGPPPAEHGVDLGAMLLTLPDVEAELPDMILDPSGTGRQPAGRAAANTISPEDRAEDLEGWGRVDGHICFFVDPPAFGRQVTGRPAAVSCSVELYETEDQAAEAVRREVADYQRMAGRSLDGSVALESFEEAPLPNVGTGAAAGRAVAVDPGSEKVFLDLVFWVRGRVAAMITLISLEDIDKKDALDRLAVAMDNRIEAALEE